MEPVYDYNLNKLTSINPIHGITGYTKYKKMDRRMKKIINKGFLT